ncbi:S8 family peptidase [Poritiphilus flavus]|uniref:S8 family serine peptidase n=1 Tax=Poritiphilus flavus TaxID=2697053 RepID=A0A6L9E8D3_9FLAO|nr:S8 family peptidase [Poritiphilus flavus]NAS11037.1 S8 family serine peptidase [Poritiphilus flavus]
MKIRFFKLLCGPALGILILSGCGGTSLILTPVENIDNVPLKITELSESEKRSWGHADLTTDTIPGMSVNRAYRDIIGTKKGKKVIVAVIDSGMDLEHEDLDGVLWTNKRERPGNGKDDDKNGYVDDIHGYNFLGASYNEQLEFTRIVKLKLADADTQLKAKSQLDSESSQAKQNKQQYEQILQTVKNADEAVKKHLGKDTYDKEDITQIKTEDQAMQQHIGVLMQMYSFADSIPEVLEELKDGINYFSEQLNYHLNAEFDGRKPVGDNPYDFDDKGYGNGNPQNMLKDESHGTHVAGIIGAERDNGVGMKGVANNVALMSLRAVPNGDEYDKDIALAIRYAVDNGAKVINASFGKSFSPNADWVYDAIKYAAEKDVLIVHAAGNDGNDLDNPANPNFPNDQINNGPEFADNVITVGALASKYGSEMVASYSNYGAINVDVFAPGSDIYSTQPGNKYEFSNGTSFAAPGVSGIAALIRSHYPKLTASEVKKIIMTSGLRVKTSIIVSGDASKASYMDKISKSGRIANAYNALIMAEQVAKGKLKV